MESTFLLTQDYIHVLKNDVLTIYYRLDELSVRLAHMQSQMIPPPQAVPQVKVESDKPPALEEDDVTISDVPPASPVTKPVSERHKWTANELETLSRYFQTMNGVWSDTVSYELSSHIPASVDGLFAKWENCRYLKTGTSEYNSRPTKMHTEVWKKLGFKVRK